MKYRVAIYNQPSTDDKPIKIVLSNTGNSIIRELLCVNSKFVRFTLRSHNQILNGKVPIQMMSNQRFSYRVIYILRCISLGKQKFWLWRTPCNHGVTDSMGNIVGLWLSSVARKSFTWSITCELQLWYSRKLKHLCLIGVGNDKRIHIISQRQLEYTFWS